MVNICKFCTGKMHTSNAVGYYLYKYLIVIVNLAFCDGGLLDKNRHICCQSALEAHKNGDARDR